MLTVSTVSRWKAIVMAKRGDRLATKSGTAYDILRHCGVDLVKKDFLGTPGQSLAD
jgi:hypothetical protein